MGSAVQNSRKVAVIGAGAAGLASIKELLAEGHAVTGFEQGAKPGGVWVYDDATDSDLLSASQSRRKVHGSMYRDLRTNLPRELMGFAELPFTPAAMGPASSDPRRFCSHREVLAYLDVFAGMHQQHQHVHFNTQVLQATPLPAASSNSSSNSSSSRRWQVQSVRLGPDGQPQQQPQQQEFDALVVANGHYSEPNLPQVPGSSGWPGLQMHSHNYRAPEAFRDQVVVVVGASNSGEDVCREVSAVASQVILAARSWKNPAWGDDPRPFGPRNNVSRRGMISQLHPDGRVDFTQGPALPAADAIIYCTGYRYKFPFLEQHPDTAGLSGQQHVPGLYQHMFVPQLGPSLAFVGLPWKVVPFPQFELQAKLIARLLSGRAQLPPVSEMQAHRAAHYAQMQAEGVPLRHCHMMGEQQWAYNDWLAEAAGADVAKLPAWRAAMYASTGVNKRAHPDDYRDRWDDASSAAAAEAELAVLTQQLKALHPAAAAAAAAAAVAS
ncbi:hypothetical protein OEZ86_001056 [Tetradesmus obliquus]|nr:hypothetical protein OEZ86_001056 [Tetradesmus obliquus]